MPDAPTVANLNQMLGSLKKLFFSALAVFLFCGHLAEARRPVVKIKVQAELRAELNSVLRATADLQEASFKRNETLTSTAVKTLVKRLNQAEAKSGLAKEQRTHLAKILVAARTSLEKSRRSQGADRHTFFQHAFGQLVLLAQVYQLEPYKMFFCPKDKSVWLQRKSKPQNPVNPETYGDCGKQVT